MRVQDSDYGEVMSRKENDLRKKGPSGTRRLLGFLLKAFLLIGVLIYGIGVGKFQIFPYRAVASLKYKLGFVQAVLSDYLEAEVTTGVIPTSYFNLEYTTFNYLNTAKFISEGGRLR
jgi:hypothetical protein